MITINFHGLNVQRKYGRRKDFSWGQRGGGVNALNWASTIFVGSPKVPKSEVQLRKIWETFCTREKSDIKS